MEKIRVKNKEICVTGIGDQDYISLTDIARLKNPKEPKSVIQNWMRLRSTLAYLALWESLNNSNFRGTDFDTLLGETEKI